MKTRKILAWLLTLAMIMTIVPSFSLTALADSEAVQPLDDEPTILETSTKENTNQSGGVVYTKTSTAKSDGTIDIELSAYTEGTVTSTTTVKPVDIVLVLDVSGSMRGDNIDDLKEAVNAFIDETAKSNEGQEDNKKHRISIIKFAGPRFSNNSQTNPTTAVGNSTYRGNLWETWNYTQVVRALTTVDSAGAASLKSAVNILDPAGPTAVDKGLRLAKAVLDETTTTDRDEVVIVFTDGEPNHSTGFIDDVANDAIDMAKNIKDSGATIFGVCIADGANSSDTESDINKFMHYVSSNYPNATRMNNSGSRAEGSDFYMTTSEASDLTDIFVAISGGIAHSPVIELGSEAKVVDTLSPFFNFKNASASGVQLMVSDRNADGTWDEPVLASEKGIALTPVFENDRLTVVGFDFDANHISEVGRGENGDFYGRKLVIKFTVDPDYDAIDAASVDFADGILPTNTGLALLNDSTDEPAAGVVTPELNTHQVTYVVDGEVYEISGEDAIYNRFTGSSVEIVAKPTKEGYTFNGWTMDGVPVVPGDEFTMPDNDVEIVGTFTIKNSPVRYEIDGAALGVQKPDTKNYDYNEIVDVEDDLVVPGYIFSGWYTDDVTVSGDEFTMPAHEVVFYGRFEPADVHYTVEYYFENIEGDTDPADIGDYVSDEEAGFDANYSEIAQFGTIARAELKTFTGYTLNRDPDISTISGQVTVDSDGNGTLVLKLYYALNRHSVTYSYVGGFAPDGTVPCQPDPENPSSYDLSLHNLTEVKYGSEVTVIGVPEIPDDSSYSFDRWFADNVAGITAGGTFTMPDVDVHINGSFHVDGEAQYRVEHYLEDDAGDFVHNPQSDVTLYITPDTVAHIRLANAFTFEGYEVAGREVFEREYPTQTYNETDYRLEQTIADGDDPIEVFKIYYTRKLYEVSYEFVPQLEPDTSGLALPGTTSHKYRSTVEVDDFTPVVPGYTFSGWDTEDATVVNGEFTMPAKNVVLRGRFSPANVQWIEEHYLEDPENIGNYIQDVSDTGTITHHNFTGTEVTVHAGHYHGYTFNAEKTDEENDLNGVPALVNNAVTTDVLADGSLVVQFYYDCNTYKVEYEYETTPPEGADDLTSLKQEDVPYGKEITVAQEPEVPGYTFSGWATENATIVGGKFDMPDNNVKLKGRFTANDVQYQVKYFLQNIENDEYTEDTDSSYERTAKMGEHVEADRISFEGFTYNPNHPESKPYGHVSVDSHGDGNLVLKIYLDRIVSNITYVYAGETPEGAPDLSPLAQVGVRYGKQNIEVAEPVALDGYAFEGWNTHTAEVNDGKFNMPAHDVIFYGSLVKYYDVKYDLNGGTGADGVDYTDKTVAAGTVIDVNEAPTRANYTFTGWKEDTTDYNPFDAVAVHKDLLFVAQWSYNGGGGGGGVTRYTLTYETNGGSPISKETYARNANVKLTKVPKKDGYVFEGWYQDKELTESVSEVKMTKNITVYAAWVEDNGGAGNGYDTPGSLNGEDHFAYVVGYPDGTVRPNDNISRAEVTSIFFRLLKPDEVRDKNLTSDNNFNDVNDGDWHNTSISTMAKLGIVKGRDVDSFIPDAFITRAEFAAICARFDKSEFEVIDSFTDVQGHWAEHDIHEAAAHGWIRGYEDGTFKPDQFITRAEAMTMINRVLNRVPETADDLLADMISWPDNSDKSAWYYLAVQEATNSHDYEMKNHIYEKWTALRDATDWKKYE